MRSSRTAVGVAAVLLVFPVVLAGPYAQTADRGAARVGEDAEKPSPPNRKLRNSGTSFATKRSRDPNAPPWQPPPVPATIPIRIAGVARDAAGRAIAGATITLYPITDKESKPVGTCTTDAQGRYVIRDVMLPVLSSFGGHPFRKEITPYAGFIVSGLAPGLGIAWSPQQSMYALKEPQPDDRHQVKSNPITMTFPKIRPIAVTVVGDDTGKPVAGAHFSTLGDSLATGIASYETTDAAGKILLGLPPGTYKGIVSDPPIETRYIRTYQRPLVVERGEGAQPYELRQKAGVELILEAVGARPGNPVAEVFFWKAPEERPEETQQIKTSTFRTGSPWTDAKGELRAVLAPEPGRLYRFRFAGIHEPNMPPGINAAAANKHGYAAFPTQSAPVELIAGKTIRLRFILHKID